MRRGLVAGWSALVLVLAGCGGEDAATPPPSSGETSASASPTRSQEPSDKPGGKPSATPTESPGGTGPGAAPRRSVLVISVDGLSVDALVQLGRSDAPAIYRLLDGGAGTLNARTAVEQTVTLPNHTSMLTGRRIDAQRGGHGVTWNEEVPGAVVPGQGRGVESVFDVVGRVGSTAMFAGKDKFALYERSWGDVIDEFEIDLDSDRLVATVRDDLVSSKRRLTFVHLALPDTVGHAAGWMSPTYLDAVKRTDVLVGELLATVDATPRLSRRLVVVLTADHGGVAGVRDHGDTSALANFRVPFVVWGPGIPAADLYDLNTDYSDPGTGIPAYDGPQPVRNGDVANVVTDLLGLKPVPGSELNAEHDLDVTPSAR